MHRGADGGPAADGQEPPPAEPAAAEGTANGLAEADPPLPPQEEAGGWSTVQDGGNAAVADNAAARFAPGSKFVLSTA